MTSVPGHANRYGREHRALRRGLVTEYEAQGRGWACSLCGEAMYDMPRLLDLAHAPGSLSHAGLAHRRCNRGDAAKLGNVSRTGKIDPAPTPRTRW